MLPWELLPAGGLPTRDASEHSFITIEKGKEKERKRFKNRCRWLRALKRERRFVVQGVGGRASYAKNGTNPATHLQSGQRSEVLACCEL